MADELYSVVLDFATKGKPIIMKQPVMVAGAAAPVASGVNSGLLAAIATALLMRGRAIPRLNSQRLRNFKNVSRQNKVDTDVKQDGVKPIADPVATPREVAKVDLPKPEDMKRQVGKAKKNIIKFPKRETIKYDTPETMKELPKFDVDTVQLLPERPRVAAQQVAQPTAPIQVGDLTQEQIQMIRDLNTTGKE